MWFGDFALVGNFKIFKWQLECRFIWILIQLKNKKPRFCKNQKCQSGKWIPFDVFYRSNILCGDMNKLDDWQFNGDFIQLNWSNESQLFAICHFLSRVKGQDSKRFRHVRARHKVKNLILQQVQIFNFHWYNSDSVLFLIFAEVDKYQKELLLLAHCKVRHIRSVLWIEDHTVAYAFVVFCYVLWQLFVDVSSELFVCWAGWHSDIAK